MSAGPTGLGFLTEVILDATYGDAQITEIYFPCPSQAATGPSNKIWN